MYVLSQNAITADVSSKRIPPFGFALQCRCASNSIERGLEEGFSALVDTESLYGGRGSGGNPTLGSLLDTGDRGDRGWVKRRVHPHPGYRGPVCGHV